MSKDQRPAAGPTKAELLELMTQMKLQCPETQLGASNLVEVIRARVQHTTDLWESRIRILESQIRQMPDNGSSKS